VFEPGVAPGEPGPGATGSEATMSQRISTSRARMRVMRIPASQASRFYDWLRGSPAGLGAVALVIGLGAGVGAVVFRELIAP
jgi:hypothetical protein